MSPTKQKLLDDIAAGLAGPADGETTVHLAVKVGVVIDLALDPGETLKGDRLVEAIVAITDERVTLGFDGADPKNAFDDLIDDVQIVDASYTDKGQPPKPADITLLSDRKHTWKCDGCERQIPWQPGNICGHCGTIRWPEPADAEYWMDRLKTSGLEGIDQSRAVAMLRIILQELGHIPYDPERPSEALMRRNKDKREKAAQA